MMFRRNKALQNALSTEKLDHLRYYAFDLLHLNGVDLRARPLTERKALLQEHYGRARQTSSFTASILPNQAMRF